MKQTSAGIKAMVMGALCFSAASNVNAGTLFIGGWDTHTVYSVDLNTQVLTPIVSGFGLISGMEGIGNDLYVFDQVNDQVSKIDPDNGSTLTTYSLAALGINVTGEGTFAMHSDLTGFTSSSSGSTGTYWAFDLVNNTSASLGTGISFDGVDFAPNGVLYGLTQSSSTTGGSALYTIDPTDGSTTLIGSTGVEGASLAALVVAEGDFIAAIGASLYQIDPVTAAATFLFSPSINGVSIGDISGAAYLGSTDPVLEPTPAPEPASLALMGLGLAALAASRRRKLLR